ncbi:MAG: lipocalin family protein [Alistipes sp.]|nr:lipocalin family protein [Alistipes sp.]
MKTLKTIIACLILAISCVAFVGCNKDKEENNNGNANSIVGTWRYSESGGSYGEWTFTASGMFEYRYGDMSMNHSDSYSGTYEYKAPYLTYHIIGETETFTEHVVIEGNKMIMNGEAVYYRQ